MYSKTTPYDRRARRGALGTLCAAAVAICLALAPSSGANALNPSAPSQIADAGDFSEARAFLTQYGVPPDTQEGLIRSARQGQRWDSMSSQNAPVSSDSYAASDGDYTVNRYEDGSVSVTRLETQADARGISGCSVQGNLRSNCKIDTWVGLVSMSFFATYNLGTGTVNNVYGAGWSIGGSCNSLLVYLGRPAANIGLEQVSAQMCGLPYNTVFSLQLTVGGGNASVTWY